MNFFSTFAITYGAGLACQAVMAGFIFRTSSAPRWLKYVLPTTVVVTASVAPFEINTMMGYPMSSSMSSLPDKMRVIEFVPHDDIHRVDVWTVVGTDPPRAYELDLTESMKETLRNVRQRLEQGGVAYVMRRHVKLENGSNFGDDESSLVLDDSVRSKLPDKDGR